jgi:hypothetical protein
MESSPSYTTWSPCSSDGRYYERGREGEIGGGREREGERGREREREGERGREREREGE